MKKPLFRQVKEFIQEQINSGVYKKGDKIPTEQELTLKFKVSRQTVNKAIRDLANENVVERFARSGTFVKEKSTSPSTTLLELKNIAHEIKSRGNDYSSEVLTLKEIKANEELAKILNIVKDQKVYLSEIIHKENNIPVRFDIRYVKISVAPEYIKQDFKQITPHEYLEIHNPAQRTENTIEAKIVSKRIQKILEISKNEPCLLVSRLVYSKGVAGGYSKLYYPSSRYKLNSSFNNKTKS